LSNSSGIIQEDPVPGWHLRSSSIKRRSGAAGRSIALPTSAGKTRIAELAALMTLSAGKRVLIVTPLRALSAQTERSFRRTFGPLGFSVSSLYGASGVSATDEDALRSKNIVIATPEKLDFALRNDPSIIADVGLIVLDEGHMIGPTEREIRYETLVQRLLRREDAASRRIVCLSAILPEGDQLDDLTAWIRNDAPGGPVTFRWRPMRQRFGHLIWRSATRNKPAGAQLYFDSRTEVPFLARFIEEIPSASSSETTLAARSERPVNLCGVEVRGTRQANADLRYASELGRRLRQGGARPIRGSALNGRLNLPGRDRIQDQKRDQTAWLSM
jgi:hypothetical protein